MIRLGSQSMLQASVSPDVNLHRTNALVCIGFAETISVYLVEDWCQTSGVVASEKKLAVQHKHSPLTPQVGSHTAKRCTSCKSQNKSTADRLRFVSEDVRAIGLQRDAHNKG